MHNGEGRGGALRGPRRVHWGRVVFYGAVALVALWIAWAARGIWFPVAIAFLIAMVLDPTVDRLENRGCPRALGTALVFLLFIGGALLAVILLSPAISKQAGDMAADLATLFPDPENPSLVPATEEILRKLDAHPALKDALVQAARTGTGHLSRALRQGSELALAWTPNLVWFIVVPVLSFYVLNDFHKIYAKAVLLVPPRHRPFAQTLIAEISALFGKYLRGLGLLCVLLGVSIAALLFALGNPYWQLLGLLGGLLYAIPVVGSLFNLGLVVLITLATATPQEALLAGGLLLLLTNGIFDQVVTPRILGKQVGLHPVLTILALLVGYQIWGITGMLVAVPLAASIQTVVIHLVPKLGVDLALRPLSELQRVEAETKGAHLAAEEKPLDEHLRLQSVIENVDEQIAAEAEQVAADAEAVAVEAEAVASRAEAVAADAEEAAAGTEGPDGRAPDAPRLRSPLPG